MVCLTHEQTVAATHLTAARRVDWMRSGGHVREVGGKRKCRACHDLSLSLLTPQPVPRSVPSMNSPKSTKWRVQFLPSPLTVLWVLIVAATGCSTVPALRRSVERNTGAVVTETQGTIADTQFALSKPSSSQPVTAAMKTTPTEVRAGEIFEILVRVEIAGAHHIYASNVVGKPFPISLNVTFPGGIEASGDWIAPAPSRTKTGELVYTDCVSFRRSLKVGSNVPGGPLSIKGELLYQACTEELCWPPRTIKLSSSVTVRSLKR